MIVRVIPLALASGVVAVNATDQPLGAGVLLPVAVIDEGPIFEVKLAALLKAGAGGNVALVLAWLRADGSAEMLDGTRLPRVLPAYDKLVSSSWVTVQRPEPVGAFALYGRAETAAGAVLAPALLLRVHR